MAKKIIEKLAKIHYIMEVYKSKPTIITNKYLEVIALYREIVIELMNNQSTDNQQFN